MLAAGPRARLYIISWGFKSTELIMKAASQSCRMPFSEKDAAIGIVPYMHNGDRIPRMLAGIIFLVNLPESAVCQSTVDA